MDGYMSLVSLVKYREVYLADGLDVRFGFDVGAFLADKCLKAPAV